MRMDGGVGKGKDQVMRLVVCSALYNLLCRVGQHHVNIA